MTTDVQNHRTDRAVAVYCRISADPGKKREGVRDQERWGRSYAAETWPDLPVEVYCDNNVSAAKRDDQRPAFRRLCDDIAAGKVAHVWASWQSRLARRANHWHTFADVLRDAGIGEVHTRNDGVRRLDDLATDIMADVDAHYVREITRKIVDRKRELWAAGRPDGMIGFGYRNVSDADHIRLRTWRRQRHLAGWADMDEDEQDAWLLAHPKPATAPLVDEHGRKAVAVVSDEADLIRDVAGKVLDGWTQTSIAKYMNTTGIYGHRGADWSVGTVKKVLIRPAIAGKYAHIDESTGEYVITRDAKWDEILDESTWRLVAAVLNGDRTVTQSNGITRQLAASVPNARRGTARRHLLTGIATCGRCGAPCQGAYDRSKAPTYRCNVVKRGGRCVAIAAIPLEAWVCEALLKHLQSPDYLDAIGNDDSDERRDELVAELRDVEAEGLEVAEMQRDGKLLVGQLEVLNAGLRDRTQRINRDLAALPVSPPAIDVVSVCQSWHSMPFDERRHVVETVIDRVVIRPVDAQRVTGRTIAARLGVSVATVSNVMNGKGKTSAATQQRVRALADQLGYAPMGRGGGQRPKDRAKIEWRTDSPREAAA